MTVSGDISHIEILGRHIVVLNSVKVAVELLDKKSSKYSDRPILPMGGELVGWKHALPLLPYGNLFRESRKQFHRAVGTRAALKAYHPIRKQEFHKFLKRLNENPDDFALHIRR